MYSFYLDKTPGHLHCGRRIAGGICNNTLDMRSKYAAALVDVSYG